MTSISKTKYDFSILSHYHFVNATVSEKVGLNYKWV